MTPVTPEPAERVPDLDMEGATTTGANAESRTSFPPWPAFLQTAKDEEIKERFVGEVTGILALHGMDTYCPLAILEPRTRSMPQIWIECSPDFPN
jgi:hypothetical protein